MHLKRLYFSVPFHIAIYILNDGIAKASLFIYFSNGRLNIAYLKNNNKMHQIHAKLTEQMKEIIAMQVYKGPQEEIFGFKMEMG